MNKQRIWVATIVGLALALGMSLYVQLNRPYRNGSVWNVAFVHVKNGMQPAYMKYLVEDWTKTQEAGIKQGPHSFLQGAHHGES